MSSSHSCSACPPEQALVLETCKEVKLPGPCAPSKVGEIELSCPTPAGATTICIRAVDFLAPGQGLAGCGLGPETFISSVRCPERENICLRRKPQNNPNLHKCKPCRRGCHFDQRKEDHDLDHDDDHHGDDDDHKDRDRDCDCRKEHQQHHRPPARCKIRLSTPTCRKMARGLKLEVFTPGALQFSDFSLLFDSTQCGAPRFAVIEVTNLGNCTVTLLAVTSLACIPSCVVAILTPPNLSAVPPIEPAVGLAPGVSGINLVNVPAGQSTILTTCDLVALFSFCFSPVTPSPQTAHFTMGGCDFTFSIKAFFCIPGCTNGGCNAAKQSSCHLNLVKF